MSLWHMTAATTRGTDAARAVAPPRPGRLQPELEQWFVFAYDEVRALLVDERLTADRMHRFAQRAPAQARDTVRCHAPWFVRPSEADDGWIGPIVHAGLRKPGGGAVKSDVERDARELGTR